MKSFNVFFHGMSTDGKIGALAIFCISLMITGISATAILDEDPEDTLKIQHEHEEKMARIAETSEVTNCEQLAILNPDRAADKVVTTRIATCKGSLYDPTSDEIIDLNKKIGELEVLLMQAENSFEKEKLKMKKEHEAALYDIGQTYLKEQRTTKEHYELEIANLKTEINNLVNSQASRTIEQLKKSHQNELAIGREDHDKVMDRLNAAQTKNKELEQMIVDLKAQSTNVSLANQKQIIEKLKEDHQKEIAIYVKNIHALGQRIAQLEEGKKEKIVNLNSNPISPVARVKVASN